MTISNAPRLAELESGPPWRELVEQSGLPEEVLRIGLLELLKFPERTVPASQILDLLIADIDDCLGHQMDALLHAPALQALESAWRGLKWVVDRVDSTQRIALYFWSVTRDELQEDIEEGTSIVRTHLYRIVYSAEYGTFGGEPYGAVLVNESLGSAERDIYLLRSLAAVGAMAHVPFFASAAPSLLGVRALRELPELRHLRWIEEDPRHRGFQSLRDIDDARYLGLLLPRILLRHPYGTETVPIDSFPYEETLENEEDALWGSAIAPFAVRLADSFARCGWCTSITGTEGGVVRDTIVHSIRALGPEHTKPPVDVVISEERAHELGAMGFIPLAHMRETGGAIFLSAHSVQRPRHFGNHGEGRAATLNFLLAAQFPHLFISCRVSHYIKVVQREVLGHTTSPDELETALNNWIGQLVVDMESTSAAVRARYPLRQALVRVSQLPNKAGWYQVQVMMRPHLRYMGTTIRLSVSGRIDRRLGTS